MATIKINVQAQNQAARELIQLRQQLHQLNRRLEQQRQALRGATVAERKSIQAKIDAIQALQRQNRLEQESVRLKQQAARAAVRETQAIRQSEGNFRRFAQVLVRTTSSYGGFIESIGSTAFVVNLAGFYVGRFVHSLVQVAAEAERFNSVLEVTTSDARAVGSQIRALQRDLITTDFSTITQTFNALNAATDDVERSIDTIRGLGVALGTLNTAAYDQSRFFVQLRQLYAQNKLEADEFKILQETLPNVLTLTSRALGVQVASYKELKDFIDGANISVREYIDTLADYATAELPGVDPSTYTAQVAQLNETIRQIQREIGQVLIPILAQGARELRTFLQAFSSISLQNISGFISSVVGITLAVYGVSRAFQDFLQGFLIFRGTVFNFSLWNAFTEAISSFFIRSGIAAQRFSTILNTRVIPAVKNFIATMKALEITFSTGFLIAGITTFLAAFLAVRDEVRRIEESISDLDRAFARVGQFFYFDDALGRVRQFSDLTVSELTRSVNSVIDARQSIEAEFRELSERLNIPVIELAFLDAREILDAYDIYGSGLDNLIEQIEELQSEYNIAEKTIQRFKDRIDELKAATEATARATSSLLVELARINSRLQQAQSDFQVSVSQPATLGNYRDRVAAIQSAAQQEIAVLRDRAEIERRLLEETEDDKNKIQAGSIDIQTRLRRDIERVVRRSEQRIAEVTQIAADERIEIEKRVLEQRSQLYAAFLENRLDEARKAQQKEALIFLATRYADEIKTARNLFNTFFKDVRDRARETGTDITNYFQQTLRGVQNYNQAIQKAREQAIKDRTRQAPQRELPGLRQELNLDFVLTGQFGAQATAEDLAAVYAEYLETYRETATQTFLGRIQEITEQAKTLIEAGITEAETRGEQAERLRKQRLQRERRERERLERDQERILQRELRARVRLYQQYASEVVPILRSVIDSQIDGTEELVDALKRALRELITASVSRIIQDKIEKAILIANERRYQAELIKTAALKKQAIDTNSLLSTAALQTAAGVAGGVGFPGVPVLPALQLLLQIGAGQIREIDYEISKLTKQNRR